MFTVKLIIFITVVFVLIWLWVCDVLTC